MQEVRGEREEGKSREQIGQEGGREEEVEEEEKIDSMGMVVIMKNMEGMMKEMRDEERRKIDGHPGYMRWNRDEKEDGGGRHSME